METKHHFIRWIHHFRPCLTHYALMNYEMVSYWKVFTSILWKPATVLSLSGSKEALQNQKETKHIVAIHIWLGLLWLLQITCMYIYLLWNIICSQRNLLPNNEISTLKLSRKPLTSMGPVTVIKQLHLVEIQLSTNDTFPALFCSFPFLILTNTWVSVSYSWIILQLLQDPTKSEETSTVQYVIYNIN